MAVSKRLRYEILRRDNHACRYCGSAAPDAKLNVDHVIPQALGGTDKPNNLVTACAECNVGKTSSMPGAQVVEDVEQETFRQAAARNAQPTHDPETGMPTCWSFRDVELAIAEFCWHHAWSIATDGNSPSLEQYDEFLRLRDALAEDGRSVVEIVCAAVLAGAAQTPQMSWGLSTAQMRHAPISSEQFSLMDGAFELWLSTWRNRHDTEPRPEQIHEYQGRLVQAVRSGHSRDVLLRASRSAGFAGTSDVDYFAYHIACEDSAEKVGDH